MTGSGKPMTFNKGLFLSQRLDWRTPQGVYDKLNEEFHFDFDPCPANPTVWMNSGVSLFHPTFDGLSVPWGQSTFCNPPYGREVGKWIKKGWQESLLGKTVVLLVAARTDTAWWHDYCLKGEIRFIRGRLRFDDQKNSAPFPSAIIVFKGG